MSIPRSSFRRKPESILILLPLTTVQSFRAAPLRGSLLALPKSNQKARHRTRWFDSHRANRTALRFSSRRGCSNSTSMYCFAIAAIHRRDPAGIFPPHLRCSAPRTAPYIHESVRPWTVLMQSCVSLPWSRERLLLLLRQDAAQTGPPEARRGCAGSVRRRAHTMCARSPNVHGRTSGEPRSTLADLEGRMPGRRAAGGGLLFGYFLLAIQEKVTRSPEASGSFALQENSTVRSRWIPACAGMTDRGDVIPAGAESR